MCFLSTPCGVGEPVILPALSVPPPAGVRVNFGGSSGGSGGGEHNHDGLPASLGLQLRVADGERWLDNRPHSATPSTGGWSDTRSPSVPPVDTPGGDWLDDLFPGCSQSGELVAVAPLLGPLPG